MNHLSDAERLDWAESRRGPEGHLADCVACREDVERLRSFLDEVRANDIPEPSPLFWDHFPRRVMAALETEAPGRAARWWDLGYRWRLVVPAVATLAVAAVAVTVSLLLPASSPLGPSGPKESLAAPADADGARVADDAWALVEQAADDADREPADTVEVAAGTSDAAMTGLNAAEMNALAALLRDELAQASRAGTK